MGEKRTIPVLVGPLSGPVHGVSMINAKLAAAMTAQGLRVEIIDLAPGGSARSLIYHATRSWRVFRGMVRIALARGRHYVMSVDGGGGLAYNAALALAARLTGRPLMLYHHSTRYVFADSALMRFLLAVAGPAAPHVFCSADMAALFRRRYAGAGPAMIVGNAAWVDESAPGEGSPGGLRLGFLSTLTEEKGLGRVLETMRACHGLGAELALAGPMGNDTARRMVSAAQSEWGPALQVRGLLAGEDKADFYRSLDVFLFPSLYPHETQSLVVPEALAAGTPVIAYDHRFVGEILGRGPGGLLILAQEDFAPRAARFIAGGRDPAVRAARRAAALARYRELRSQAKGQVGDLIRWASAETP